MIVIEKPIYNGDPEKRTIGLAEFRLRNESERVEIKIVHKRTSGQYVYPNFYTMTKTEISKYPREPVGRDNVICYIIPIKDLEIKFPVYNSCPVNTLTCPAAEPVNKQGTLF